MNKSNGKRVEKISSTTKETSYPINEGILDDVSSCDEQIYGMVEVLNDWHMEKINKNKGRIQSFEDVKEVRLIEQVQPPCTKYYELEYMEVEFPTC